MSETETKDITQIEELSDIDSEMIRDSRTIGTSEKETTITFTNKDDYMKVYTRNSGIMRRMLGHEHAELDNYNVEDGYIVGMSVMIPVDCLKINKNPREYGGHAEIISP